MVVFLMSKIEKNFLNLVDLEDLHDKMCDLLWMLLVDGSLKLTRHSEEEDEG